MGGLQRGLTTAFVRESMQNVPRLGLYAPLMGGLRSSTGIDEGVPDPFSYRLGVASVCGITPAKAD